MPGGNKPRVTLRQAPGSKATAIDHRERGAVGVQRRPAPRTLLATKRARGEEPPQVPRHGGAVMDGVTIDVDPIAVAAAELLERRGYDAVTMSDIAERSGFSRQTVYARYRSKAKLLEAVVTEFFRVFPAFVLRWEEAGSADGRAAQGGGPFPPALVVDALAGFCSRWGPLARVALSARDLPWLSTPARRSCRELHQLLRYHLAAPELRDTLMDLCLDLLKHTALRIGRGTPDPAACEKLAQLVAHFCGGPIVPLRPVAADRGS